MSLTRLFVQRPTLTFVIALLVGIIALFSATTLIEEQFPNVDLPVISVQYTYVGASTSEMRDAIVRPIEDAIAGAPDLDYLKTSIQEGQATISATFKLSSDKNTDLIEVQRRVQSAQALLPTTVKTPFIAVFDPSQSIVTTLVLSSSTLRDHQLAAITSNRIIPALEQVPGIATIQSEGAVTPAMLVTVHPDALLSAGGTLSDVLSTLSANNARAPGGYIGSSGKESAIDVRGDIQSPATIANLLLPTTAGTTVSTLSPWTSSTPLLHVSDVASIAPGAEPPRSYAFYQAHPAIKLDILKASGASEVSASQAIVAALPELRRTFPQITFTVSNIQATYTVQQLTGVVRSLLEGILLTGLVMIFFLRSWRNAIVVMLAIPISLGITLGAMKLANFTIDVVSLLAMTLIIGILVDDSIVVLENIERRREVGDEPQPAAIRGRTEIGLAAIVITLVDVVVFTPIAFLPGTVGRFLNEFGLVVVVATLSSLFVSFTVTPSLAGNWSLLSTWQPPAIFNAFTRGFEAIRRWYIARALPWALRYRVIVLCFAGLSFIGALTLLPLGFVGFEFIPTVDRGQLAVQLRLPPGTSVAATRDATLRIERMIDGIGSDLQNETAIAGGVTSEFGGVVSEGSRAEIDVNLADDRRRSTEAWTSDLRQRIGKMLPDARVLVIPATGTGGGVAQPIDYVIKANGDADPTEAALKVTTMLESIPGAINVNSGAADLTPQLEITFDRDAARALNVNLSGAVTAVQAAFGGSIPTQYLTPDGLEDVAVIYPIDARHNIETLNDIPLRNNTGALIHLGDIVHITGITAPAIITRQNRQTVIAVGANVAPGYALSNITKEFNRRLPTLHLPVGVVVAPNAGGNQQNLADTVSGIGAALLLAFLLVYLLMVALFDSYRSPAIIMFSVPLAVVGALGALALTHQTLNLFSMIGTVLLIGLVSKNGILLVDFANRARLEGKTKRAAIIEAAEIRFRPIIMTTFSMVAGMLPLALALDPGAETRRALGVVVIGGLLSSLILTLLVIPIVYLALGQRDPSPPTPRRL